MKEQIKTKKDLLKEVKLLQRKVNRLEKACRKQSSLEAGEIVRNEEKYDNIFEESFDGLFITSPQGKIFDMNNRGLLISGYDTKEEIYNLNLISDFCANPSDRKRILSMFKSQCSAEFEIEFKKKNGDIRIMYCALMAVKDSSGKISKYRGIIRDISQQKHSEIALRRLNRELRAISYCNQTLFRAVNEQTLLNEICRIICEEAGYRMAWVGYAENDEAKSIRPVAWSGLDSDGYIANANLTWSDESELGSGPAGKTIRSGEINYVQDFTTDPQMIPWRKYALKCGYRSIITLPLKDENSKVFGVLLIYSSEANIITGDEIRLLEGLSGDLAFGIINLRNCIERKRMEAAVRESEEKFRMVFENVSDGICLCIEDPDPNKRKIIDCNERYAILTGRSREDLLQLESMEGLRKVLDGSSNKNRLDSLEKGTVFQGTFSWNRPDGKENVIEYVGKSVAWRGKTYTIGIDRDVTERIRMEEEVRETQEKFRLVFQHAFDGISIYSEDPDPFKRKLVDCNEQYAAQAGRSREELLQLESPQTLMVPYDDTTNLTRLESLDRGTAYQGYSSWIRPDGKKNIIEYVGMPINWGGKAYTIGIDRDITERKLAEEKLEKYSQELKELNASKDKLFSIIAHDLRSPFNPLLGISEILVKEFNSLSSEEITKFNKEIFNALKNEYNLLDNLLNWSRFETGQINFNPEKINLYNITESVINLLLENAKIKEITLVNGVDKDIIVSADSNMLHSVLQNLISNSIKFTTKEGLIKTYAKKDNNDFVQITVSDNGVGMLNDQVKDLFGLTAASTQGTDNEKGTGLGLMICKEMVERHGGSITVKSEAGKGTDISFKLPKAEQI
jgi:PAS domain S-box-containing protein